MNATVEPIPSSQPLTEQYLSDYEQVKSLFEYNPNVMEDWKDRAAWLDQPRGERADRSALVDCLRRYNAERNDDDAVRSSIARLEQESTLVVVGGQQSGLLSGPLLVIYKALTIIQTARMAEKQLDRSVVPVFWIAGEDHDFDEVNHTYALTSDLQIQKIKIDHPTGKRSMVSQISIDPQVWTSLLSELDAVLPNTEFKAPLLEELQAFAGASETLSDFYARILGSLFGHHGLVLLDSADPLLRQVEAGMFAKLIANNDSLEQALFSSEADVVRHGFSAQAEVTAGNANIFYIHEGTRLLLHKEGERFADRKGEVSLSSGELLAIAKEHPERLSNNVLTRPLMQEYLLPVLATVLGPGEIAYWALTRQAFRSFGLRMPIIVPRMSFTFVEGTVQKNMTKYELTFTDVAHDFAQRREAWLQAQDQLDLESDFEALKQQLESLYKPILAKMTEVQAGLGKLGETNKQKVMEQVVFLQNRAVDGLAKQNEAALRQWDRIHASLMPLGKPQERVYNVFAYLNRYGKSWIDQLFDIPLELNGQHRVIS